MTDVTAILDESGNQLFSSAVITKCAVSPSNRFATHVVEDGTTVTDSKIKNNVMISMTLFLNENNYQETYKNIQTADDNTTALMIQTRTATYTNMYISAYPSEESATISSTIAVTIDFEEQRVGTVKTVALSTSDVNNPADASQVNRGEQLPIEDNKTSLQKIAEYFQ